MELLSGLFAELFKSWIGILAFTTIAMIIVIATFMFLWIKKQADKENKS